MIYPIFDVSRHGRDLHLWLRDLEECVITALAKIGIPASRESVNSGVWVGGDKICAIGIKLRRWISMHGLALNCDVDLEPFGTIVPCGIRGDYGVTSITRVLGRPVTTDEMKEPLIDAFAARF